jgi:acyl carrier protein
MEKVTEEVRAQIREIVLNFFSEECEKDVNLISDDTDVINDLEGDSLLFIELLQLFKKKYNLTVSMQSVGKYMLQNRAETVGKVIELMVYVIENEHKLG